MNHKHVHRRLHFGRPTGPDVVRFNRAIHKQLQHRKLGFLFQMRSIRGRRHTIARTIFALGLNEKARKAALEGNVGEWTQRKIRNPILRSPLERARAGRRRKHLSRWRRNHREVKQAPVIMFDSVTPSEIPVDAPAVAGYTGGMWPTYWELDELFPHARRISIAVRSSEDADVLDVEPGNATAADTPAWVRRQLERRRAHAGFYNTTRPIIYCSVSDVAACRAALRAAGLLSEVRFWSAHIGQGAHICSPHSCGWHDLEEAVDGTQWTWTSQGRNLDESLLSLRFFD